MSMKCLTCKNKTNKETQLMIMRQVSDTLSDVPVPLMIHFNPSPTENYTMASLPPIPGPKLGRFELEGTAKISFLKKLGGGEDATAYKVRLNGKIFVLKVVQIPPPTTSVLKELLIHDTS